MTPAPVALRRIPHPHRAMLAICSDLDLTPDRDVYFETARFLSSHENTRMGPGLGLEVGNSIYFDMAPDQFAYWNTDDQGRAGVRALIQSGHIDVIHSFGDLARERAHAARALEELERQGCRIETWVDHSVAPSNLGSDIMKGHGDEPGSPVYHADLSRAYGIRYIWRGRTTSVIGQDRPASLRGLFDGAHPRASTVTLAKELAKQALARGGHDRYRMHAANAVLRPVVLRDGGRAWEFLRSNPSWGGVSHDDTARGLGEVLTDRFLHRLEAREGISILYTHLGKVSDRREPLPPSTRAGLLRLKTFVAASRILLTTTTRLLRYVVARDTLRFTAEVRDGVARVVLQGADDPVTGPRALDLRSLDGLSFEARAERIELRLADGTPVPCVETHLSDRTCATVAWRPLSFPQGLFAPPAAP